MLQAHNAASNQSLYGEDLIDQPYNEKEEQKPCRDDTESRGVHDLRELNSSVREHALPYLISIQLRHINNERGTLTQGKTKLHAERLNRVFFQPPG